MAILVEQDPEDGYVTIENTENYGRILLTGDEALELLRGLKIELFERHRVES